MTYELFEEAKELYGEIEHLRSVLSLFTTGSKLDVPCKRVILQRFNNSTDLTNFGTEKIGISNELASVLYDVVYAEKEKLEKEFAELGENL